MRGKMNLDSLPGCIGYFGAPTPPNPPCEECEYSTPCRKIQAEFVPKPQLERVLRKVEDALAKIKR